MKLVMHLKHDLSYKMCGTRELFLAFLGLGVANGSSKTLGLTKF